MAHTLGELAAIINAELRGDAGYEITGVATLRNAAPHQLTFLANRHYAHYLRDTAAGAVILAAADADGCPGFTLVTADPYLAWVKALRYLHPAPRVIPGVHATASVEAGAIVAASACIGAHTSIAAGVHIADDVYIGPGCAIGAGASVGEASRLVANVTIGDGCHIGARGLLHPGVVIGADGFGIAKDGDSWLKIPQLGAVIVEDDVEIGANTTIDRGALENTVVERGVKIDNQVQIGHNTRVGAHTAIAGCAVIAGSVSIGKRCAIGGAAAISGHISIADDVTITGQSGVSNSIKIAGVYSSGISVNDNRIWRKNVARFHRLDELFRRFIKLERTLEKKNLLD